MIDGAIFVLMAEAIAFTTIPHLRRMISMRAYLPNFAAGLALMLALRVSAAPAASAWLAAWLGAAGIAHVLDLAMRLRGIRHDRSRQ